MVHGKAGLQSLQHRMNCSHAAAECTGMQDGWQGLDERAGAAEWELLHRQRLPPLGCLCYASRAHAQHSDSEPQQHLIDICGTARRPHYFTSTAEFCTGLQEGCAGSIKKL